ncbi:MULTISPECIES: O-antigen ligase family protein [Bacillus cereus group]|uniref:O-antigen ligase family protein n=1 Tax=Bacillus cereus group TaxID=86661 RepID=UPI00132EE314|nr:MULTISPECIES: O-antigen ligase family protein [Bacillus cereus group]HDR7253087.1 O-antigen ligase family protein [Bacillus pacificus]MCC2399292.1 O-antigen ligase family protein [Bacillus paranthracis]MCU5122625.1 O-antigen ligase family protein [Bacillus paranthracis]MCU5368349.1 O-antigen ligase family protein [Bacillus paranthracis]MCU5606955.1 O-antigen ligase family protein [Bacillus paranthracis]
MKYKRLPISIARIGILLIPLWWILGLNIIIFHVISLLMFISALLYCKKSNQKVIYKGYSKLLLFFIFVYASSIVINSSAFEMNRVVGSIYNLSYWIMGFCIIVSINNTEIEFKNLTKLLNSFRIVGLIQGVFCIYSIYIWKKGEYFVEIKSLLYNAIPQALRFDIIESTMNLNIVKTDWFLQSDFPRFTGFFLYPTATGVGTSIIIFLTIVYYKFVKRGKVRSFFELLIIMLPLIFSLSRTAVMSLIVAIIVVTAMAVPKNREIYLRISQGMCVGAVLFIVMYFFLDDFASFMLDSREASTGQRQIIYKMAIQNAMSSPFLGIGMKPYVSWIEVPIGSHSTYIGVLMKTGIIGFFLFISFILYSLYSWMKMFFYENVYFKKYILKYLGISVLTVVFWMLTEDIDAPQTVAYFYFISIGLMFGVSKQLKGEE